MLDPLPPGTSSVHTDSGTIPTTGDLQSGAVRRTNGFSGNQPVIVSREAKVSEEPAIPELGRMEPERTERELETNRTLPRERVPELPKETGSKYCFLSKNAWNGFCILLLKKVSNMLCSVIIFN